MSNYFKKAGALLLVVFSLHAHSQQVTDFSGKWEGTANWGVQNYTLTLELTQIGDSLTGQVFTETLNKNKFAKYSVAGNATNGVALVKGTSYVDKKGLWCLPGIEITQVNDTRIVGKWKANMIANGCLMPGIGKLDLSKSGTSSPQLVKSVPAQREITPSEDPVAGNALANELKKRDYYALVIAVQDYKDPNILDLDNPIADARSLVNELETDYSFKKENVTFLQNPDRTTIIETFDLLTQKINDADNLLVFYAGHGIWDESIEQGYWLPSDAKKSSKAAWLSNGTIRDYIRAIDSKHTLLITDACFSGGILKQREAFRESRAILEMYKLPSRRAMTSGSLKTVPDKSVFIEYLIKALKNNEQPLISADQLFTSFKYNVINNSPNGQVPQYGVIQQANDEGGDFIFLRK